MEKFLTLILGIDNQYIYFKWFCIFDILHIIIMSLITLQILQAFNLTDIASKTAEAIKEEKQRKKQAAERLTISYVLSQDGFAIAELFGYYFSQRLKQQLRIILQQRKQFRLSWSGLQALIKQFWIDLGPFKSFLPVLFSILKDRNNSISAKDLSHYIHLCSTQINPFMAKIKQTISPPKIRQLRLLLESTCERQDLKGSGFVQKIIISDIFRRVFDGKEAIQIDEKLVTSDEVNYRLLLSSSYLDCGKGIKNFLKSKLVEKIIAFLKYVGSQKRKAKKKKKQTKKQKSPTKRKDTKQQKILKQFIEENKKQIKQDRKKLQLIAKTILIECIYNAAQISYVQSDQKPQTPVRKSLYSAQPTITELELRSLPQDTLVGYQAEHNTAIMIVQRQGKVIDLLDGSIKSAFTLTPSRVLKSSPICDYFYASQNLYILREDGLLYCWDILQACYNKIVQTQFRFTKKKVQELNHRRVLFEGDGVLMVNCSESSGCLQVYSLQLQFIGNLNINKAQFGIDYTINRQAQALLTTLTVLNRDYVIKSQDAYKALIRPHFQYSTNPLGKYLFTKFASVPAWKAGDYAEWISSYKFQNPFYFSKSMMQRMKNKKTKRQDFDYLLLYQFIREGSQNAVDQFIKNSKIVEVQKQQRKKYLMTLFEDNDLPDIEEDSHISRRSLQKWLQKCGLNEEQQRILFENLTYNCEGNVCLHQILKSEQYLRIISKRESRFLPQQHYKLSNIPPLMIQNILAFPLLEFFIVSPKFPNFQYLYMYSHRNLLIGKIQLNAILEEGQVSSSPPILSYCKNSGYLSICYDNVFSLWNINTITQREARPVRILKGLEKNPIIGLDFHYFSNSLLTMTENHLKIWDLDELFFGEQATDLIFQIKPGFKALQKRPDSCAYEPKKKIMIRGKGLSCFSAAGKSSSYVVGVTSLGSKAGQAFLKLFYLNKFHIMVGSSKEFEHVPTKILRQIDAEAKRRKFGEKLNPPSIYSSSQANMIKIMNEDYKNMIRGEKSSGKQLSLKLINKVNDLHHMHTNYQKIISPSLLKGQLNIEETKYFKFNLLLKIYLTETDDELAAVFTPNFNSLYSFPQGRQQILLDLFEETDRISFNRFLCLLSQLQKYTLPFSCNYSSLFLSNDNRMEIDLVSNLLSGSQMSRNIINSTVQLANQIKIGSIKSIVQKIIDRFLPTQYRFPSLRYYKALLKHDNNEPCDYFINRFQNYGQIIYKDVIRSQKGYKDIFQHIQKEKLLQKLQQLSKQYPQILKDNLQLIDISMSYNLITEQEATFYILASSNLSLHHFLSTTPPHISLPDLDSLIGLIVFAIGQKKLKIPNPHFTYQWFCDSFKDVIQNEDTLYKIFYRQLKGSLNQHIAYSSQLLFFLELSKKSISIVYNPLNWKQLLATRVYPLIDHIPSLRKRFYRIKIIDSYSFEQFIKQIIPREAQMITIRACTASKNHESFIKKFQEERALKQYTDEFINLEHLLLFLEESKNQRENDSLKVMGSLFVKSGFTSKIPTFCLVKLLSNCTTYLTRSQIIQIVSNTITNFTYSSLLEWLDKLPFTKLRSKGGREAKVVAVWQLKQFFQIDWGIFGLQLIRKYGKTTILNKCISVEGNVQGKQLAQVFTSQSLFRLFVCCFSELKQEDKVYNLAAFQKVVEREIMTPAINYLYSSFRYQIGNSFEYICEILNTISAKNEEIQLQKFVKYFLTNGETNQAIVKIILSSLVGRSKKIKLKESIAKLQSLFKQGTINEPLQKWLQNYHDEESLLSKILRIVQPHQINKKKQIGPDSLVFTSQHLNLLTQTSQKWVISYQPSLNLPQLFDKFSQKKSNNENMASLINNCILRHGIHTIYHSIDKGSFPQFYAKCRSVSKILAKLTPNQFSNLYHQLCENGKLSLSKLFRASQKQIMAQQRIGWIIQYLQAKGREQSEAQIDGQRINNLVIETQNLQTELASIANVLRYQEYLIKRYIKSANKLLIVLKHIDDSTMTYQTLIDLKLSHQQSSILLSYLSRNGQQALSMLRQSQARATASFSEEQQKMIIGQISQYMLYYQNQMSLQKGNNLFNPNIPIQLDSSGWSELIKKMRQQNSPQWSCLPSYVTLYQYCEHLLINVIFRKHTYRQMTIDQLNRGLSSTSLSLKNIYDIFSLAYSQKFIKYLPYFLPSKSTHHALQPQFFQQFKNYIIESFVKYDGANQIKYPLSFQAFKGLMGKGQKKEQANEQYGGLSKHLNIWGCGYVNLNDIPSMRAKKLTNTYVEIDSFISQTSPNVREWKKIKPPSVITDNKDKLIQELLRVEEQGGSKSKLIAQDNLWRTLGSYLSQQHRLYIQHQFVSANNHRFYNIVEIIDWISANNEDQSFGAEILQKTVYFIQNQGGIYNTLRRYHKKLIQIQQSDTYQQQTIFLANLLQQAEPVQTTSVKDYIKQLITLKNISIYKDKEKTIRNKEWLEQCLQLIVDTYNKQTRQWNSHNNQLVNFLNQLPQNQYSLIQKLYQTNYHITGHKLFDILAAGQLYFTFSSFWVYNVNSDEAYPYSKQEVNDVYRIIDINLDGNISYQQFCRFWSAVSQIFIEPAPHEPSSIQKIKNELIQTFLLSFEPLLAKGIGSQSGKITVEQLEGVTNIRNKQKIQRIVRLISPEDRVAVQIDIHKLKILIKQLKQKTTKVLQKQSKQKDYFSVSLGSEILQFIGTKQNFQNTLSRWLVFTYPYFGYYIAHKAHQLNWDKAALINWLAQNKEINTPIKTLQVTRSVPQSISKENKELFNEVANVPHLLDSFYKKFLKAKTTTRMYGESISYKMHLNRIVQQYKAVLSQLQQITHLLDESSGNDVHLIYQLEENQYWQSQIQNNQNLSIIKQAVTKNSQSPISIIEKTINSNIKVQRTAYNNYSKTLFQLLNKNLRGKSNNRFSLLLNRALYSDTRISISSILEQSTSNQMTLISDDSKYKPIIEARVSQQCKLAALDAMINLVETACYLHKQYQTIGLFVNLEQLFIDTQDERTFKFMNFLGGIRLDSQGNYLQGISPLQLKTGDFSVYPPQIYQNIYTQTFDSYCLAYFLYYLYTGHWMESIDLQPSSEESWWFSYSKLHLHAKKHIQLLSIEERSPQNEGQIVFYTLLLDCTSFEWHLRPRVYQIANTLRNLMQVVSLESIGKTLLVKTAFSQHCLSAIREGKYNDLANLLNYNEQYEWAMVELDQLRAALPQNIRFFQIFNSLLKGILEQMADSSEVEEVGKFIQIASEYVWQGKTKATSFLALQAYKDVIASKMGQRYFTYCDELWKIQQFNLSVKLQQLANHNRLLKLPHSSQYYFDLATLADTAITLQAETDGKAKKHDSTKKIALSFLQSSLLSNNVNRIAALHKSSLLLTLYRHLQDPESEDVVMRIYLLASSSLQEQDLSERAMEQGYKVMMVMHNIISLDKTQKKGETVVDMLTFMNNYYNFYGEECRVFALKRLCLEQVCTLPTLSTLFNAKLQNLEPLYRLLYNLSCQESCYSKLKWTTVHAFQSCLKDWKKSGKLPDIKVKLDTLINNYEIKVTLAQLSKQSLQLQQKQLYSSKESQLQLLTQYMPLIQKHILFYNRKSSSLESGSQFRYENNFYQHFSQFLKETRVIALKLLENYYLNNESSTLIKLFLQLHLTLFPLWKTQQNTLKFFMEFGQKIYQKQCLYVQNILLNTAEKPLLQILKLSIKECRKIMVRLGIVQWFMRVIKKQHQLLITYVKKGVQNIQLRNIYAQQAQFRLNMTELLLNGNQEEIHRLIVTVGFPKYLIETMLISTVILDLRYYKSGFEVVPFRFCCPLRAQAISALAFILPNSSTLRAQIVSRLIPQLALQKQKLQIPAETAESKMRFVEALWLFGNIIQCDDERLKYEFVNSGCYHTVDQLLSKYQLLQSFFPKMNETIKTGTILKSSVLFSRLIK